MKFQQPVDFSPGFGCVLSSLEAPPSAPYVLGGGCLHRRHALPGPHPQQRARDLGPLPSKEAPQDCVRFSLYGAKVGM
jgi:hypothetical protein